MNIFGTPSLSVGDQVGRFRVVRFLARGGMGELFEAEDLKFQTRCAIKTVAAAWLGDSETVSHLERETKIGRLLNHPNVCRVFEYLEERRGGRFIGMIVMEFVDGETLDALIMREGPLSPDLAKPILSAIFDGLSEAHKHGVVHRDLKPCNVMLDHSGRTVLMDFGLARQLSEVPYSRARSSTARPASICFSAPIICASLCLLLLICFLLSFVQNRIPFRTVYGGQVTRSELKVSKEKAGETRRTAAVHRRASRVRLPEQI